MSRKAVLLDLDGTLLPIDIDDFLKSYFALLTKEFAGIFPGEEFIKHLMTATYKMIENTGEKLNKEVFMEIFFQLMEIDNQEEIMERFDLFYAEKFPLLQSGIKSRGLASQLIDKLKEKGYLLVLATNPLFPVEAIKERVRWVGIAPEDFCFITNYENMHFSKPNLKYYQEIINQLSLVPEDCIMIGNDAQEDMIAGQLGMKTYLVNDFLINRDDKEIECNWQGSFEELLDYF